MEAFVPCIVAVKKRSLVPHTRGSSSLWLCFFFSSRPLPCYDHRFCLAIYVTHNDASLPMSFPPPLRVHCWDFPSFFSEHPPLQTRSSNFDNIQWSECFPVLSDHQNAISRTRALFFLFFSFSFPISRRHSTLVAYFESSWRVSFLVVGSEMLWFCMRCACLHFR